MQTNYEAEQLSIYDPDSWCGKMFPEPSPAEHQMNFKTDVGDMERYAIEMTYKMLNGVQAPPFPFYDLEIADENFEEMEVTCSPQMTLGNRILLESLLKDLNPKARILDSKLLGNL